MSSRSSAGRSVEPDSVCRRRIEWYAGCCQKGENEMQVLYEGVSVITLWDRMPQAESLVAEDGVIVALGKRKELMADFPGAMRVSLDGAALIPAFNDCHCHILWLGMDLMKADLRACASIREIEATLRQWAEENPDRLWILGRAYDQNRLREGRHILREELDVISSHRPVCLNHVSKHGLMVNSEALRLTGITAATPDPPYGRIVRDERGEPTGLLLEGAMERLYRVMPAPDEEEMARAILQAARFMAGRGILAASDAGTGSVDFIAEFRAYALAIERGAPVRLTLMPDLRAASQVIEFASRRRVEIEASLAADHGIRFGPGLRMGAIKLYLDGSITARTAAIHEPFVDTGSKGLLLDEPESLDRSILTIHRAGFQCAIHAIGDLAIECALRGYRAAQKAVPRSDTRHRIEHCMIVNPDLIEEMRDLGIVAVVQPEFFWALGHAYRMALAERADTMMPYRSWVEAGVRLAFSSDQPVTSGDPIIGWRNAVTRLGVDGHLFCAEERLDPITALHCYTTGSAYAGFDDATGVLAPGKRADFVVLSHAPESIAEEDIKVVAVSRLLD